MSFLLRKVAFKKWEPNKNRSPSSFTADAITGCTRTTGNTLSVWRSDNQNFGSKHAESLVVAMATTMQRPDTMDLLWLDQEWLENKGIQFRQTPGSSKLIEANDFHFDLSGLDHSALAIVGEHIRDQLKNEALKKRFSKHELVKLIADYDDGSFDYRTLDHRWVEAVEKYKETS